MLWFSGPKKRGERKLPPGRMQLDRFAVLRCRSEISHSLITCLIVPQPVTR